MKEESNTGQGRAPVCPERQRLIRPQRVPEGRPGNIVGPRGRDEGVLAVVRLPHTACWWGNDKDEQWERHSMRKIGEPGQ